MSETLKERQHRYYVNKRKKNGKPYEVYKPRTGYILSNNTETLYFRSIKKIAEYFNMDTGTVYYRVYKAKKEMQICGYDVDQGIL